MGLSRGAFGRRRAAASLSLLLAVAVIIAACGDSGSSGGSATSSNAGSAKTTAAKASCIPPAPTALPADPDGVAASLPVLAQRALAGYSTPVHRSRWADFKSKHGPPYKIGFSTNFSNLFSAQILSGTRQQAADDPGKVSRIVPVAPATPLDVAAQIQQIRSLLQQGADIILAVLATPTGLNGVIDEAAARGVPVITIAGHTADKNAVNLQPNFAQYSYFGTAGLVNAMGDAKNVLLVQGVPGAPANTETVQGAKRILAACHKRIVGTITGNYDPAAAKTAVLQFLASHPGKIDGVLHSGSMGPGVIGAFQQAGRPVPAVADLGPLPPSLVYWSQHKDTHHGVAIGIPPGRIGRYSLALGLAMLEGRGVKITDVPFSPPVITAENLDAWVSPKWTSSTNSAVDGPADSIPVGKLVDAYTSRR